MLGNFKTYQLAVELYKQSTLVVMPYYLKNQLLRALSSVALNLSEGSTKNSAKEQKRFYSIALGSLREGQTALDLSRKDYPELKKKADVLGAHLFKLIKAKSC